MRDAQTPVEQLLQQLVLTQRETARVLKCSERTIRRMVIHGDLTPVMLFDRQPRFAVDDVRRIVQESKGLAVG